MTQIAFSFVLLAGAGTLLAALVALQTANTGYNMRQVLAVDVPTPVTRRRRREGDRVLSGSDAPHRRAARRGGRRARELRALARRRHVRPRRSSSPSRATRPPTAKRTRTRGCASSRLGFFAVLGVPLLAGRDFTDDDRARQRARGDRQPERRAAAVPERRRDEPAAVVDRSALRQAARRAASSASSPTWTTRTSCRGPALTIYHPVQQMGVAGRLFVHAAGDPYALVPAGDAHHSRDVGDQPVERAATLEDVRAEVLAPERLNAFVLSGFAGVALLIAVVGVAGVLAFAVSARTREFGVRLAVGSTPRHLLLRVLSEGAFIVAIGHRRRRRRAATRLLRWRRAISRTCSCRARCRSLARQSCSSAPRSSRR